MSETNGTNRDALVHEIGGLIVNDGKVAAQSWDRYALVVRFDATAIRLGGFAYQSEEWQAVTPQGTALHQKLSELREAMREPGKEPWDACVVRIDRESKKIKIEFEYEHPERWDVTPETLDTVAERARAD